ncbi:MAG: hypothetical protein QOD07_654 [Frankiaceae bacterium]|nr:hypothetical protein [Frankiaceae bacterium]
MGFRRSARLLPAAVLVVSSVAAVAPAPAATADVVTVSSDALRTGWDGAEPGLTAQPVASDGFGQLFARTVDGQVYAEPVVADGVLVVATENNVVYGLDPATGEVKWQTPQSLLGPAWPTAAADCADLRPNAGVTSTPVVDDGVVYLTAKTWDGTDATHPTYWMHALDITTGAEEPGWPVALAGAPVNDPGHPFQAQMQLQRAGLLLTGGVVYAAFASQCDDPPTRGYVMGVRTGSTPGLTTMWTSAPTDPVNGETGIWMSGSGVMTDGDGRLFVATGNGVAPPYGAAAADLTAFGDSVVRLDVQPDGSLQPADYFTPASAEYLERWDRDFGSGGVVGLPDSFGTPAHPHLAVVAGKDGRFFLLDRDHLGGRAHADADPGAVGVYGPYHGQFSHAAASPDGWIYTTEAGGPLRAWHAGVDGAGDPVLTMAGTSAATLPFGSGSPVVTSDGADDPDALVWVVSGSTTAQPTGSLQAYDAIPDATGALALRWSAPIGFAAKFTVAATDGGRVYLGTRGSSEDGSSGDGGGGDGGVVYGFGRTTPLPVTAPSWHAGAVAVGAQLGGTVTVAVPADGKEVRVTGADATGPFTVDPSALPADPVQPGGTVQLPVTFAPASAGLARGVARVHVRSTDADADDQVVAVDLDGYGEPAGLVATPSQVDVGPVPLELPMTFAVELRNPRDAPADVTALSATGGFAVVGAPPLPATIPAGGALAVRVTVTPTAPGPLAGQLTATAGDVTTTVPLAGTATTASGRLTLDATVVSAGTVAVGNSVAVPVRITNTGLGPLTVTQASVTGGDVTASPDFAAGVQVQPAQTVVETLTFRPRLPGPQTAVFRFLTTAGGRPGSVTISGYGAGVLPRLDASSWRPAGLATIKTHVAILNPLARNVAGSVVYTRQVHTAGLRATYQAYVGGGTGGSGLTFAILGTGNGPGSVGSSGPGMGVGGLGVVAVTLDTEKDGGDPSNHFVGVVVGFPHGRLTYVARAPVGPGLRVGWHTVDVRESHGSLLVSLDGRALLTVKVTLPPQAWVGFTGATGPSYEWNEVKLATVTVG